MKTIKLHTGKKVTKALVIDYITDNSVVNFENAANLAVARKS
jgi:hypothetical protein